MSELPENIYLLGEAEAEFLALEGHQRRLAAKALQKIARAPSYFGKALGRHAESDLTGFRSTHVDKGSLRIVWLVTAEGNVEIVVVSAIGSRSDEEVYIVAARRRAKALDLGKLIIEMLDKEPT